MPYTSYRDPFAEDAARAAARRRNEQERLAPTVEGSKGALTALQARGWKLGDEDDLDAIEGHIAKVAEVYRPMEVGSPMNQLIGEACQAVRTERNRRNLEHSRRVDEQRKRVSFIREAARRIEDAAQHLEWAESIEDRRAELLPRTVIPSVDPKGMDDAELRRIADESDRAAENQDGYASDMLHAADVLLTVKDPRFRSHAKTLKAIAAEATEDASAYRARVAAARGELDARAERERMEQEANAPAKAAEVAALTKRVADLESALANGGE